jgi:hypothetical protein
VNISREEKKKKKANVKKHKELKPTRTEMKSKIKDFQTCFFVFYPSFSTLELFFHKNQKQIESKTKQNKPIKPKLHTTKY